MPPVINRRVISLLLPNTRAQTARTYRLDFKGTLLSATVWASATGSPNRQTYAYLWLQKTDGVAIQQLCSGYCDALDESVMGSGKIPVDTDVNLILIGFSSIAVTLSVAIAYTLDVADTKVWQGKLERSTEGRGNIRVIADANPAAGANPAVITVPANALWKLKSYRIDMVTAVAVANRIIQMIWDDGAGINIAGMTAPVLQVASLTYRYCFSTFVDSLAAAILGDNYVKCGIPENVYLRAAARIVVLCGNIQAADDFGAANYEVEEWLDV